MDKIELLGGVEVDSAVTTKYYLQFADHEMKDLIRESVKSIITYGTKLTDLPLGQLQNQNFMIYENIELRRTDVNAIIQDEIRKAARFHKQQLDTVYLFVEGAKNSLSDMRSQNSSWIQNFNKYLIPGEQECKKTYGVAGEMLYNIFCSLRAAIEEISFLLMHLSDEGMIPVIVDSDKWQGKLIGIIINQLAATSNPLASPSLRPVFPAMSSQVKEDIVHSSTYDINSRMVLCCYEEPQGCLFVDDKNDEVSFNLAQMIARDARMARKNNIGMNELIQQLSNRGKEKIKSQNKNDGEEQKSSTFDQLKCFGLLEQLVDICGEQALTDNGKTMNEGLSFMQMLKKGASVCAKKKEEQQKESKSEVQNDKKYEPQKEKSHSVTVEKKKKLTEDNKTSEVKKDTKADSNKQFKAVLKQELISRVKKMSLTEQYKANLLPSDIMDEIELMCDEEIISSHTINSSKKVFSEEPEKKVSKGAPIHKPVSESTKLAKKVSKKPEHFKESESQLRSQMFRFNMKGSEDYKLPDFNKTQSHKIKLEKDDIMKFTKEELRKIEKVAGMGQMSCKSDISSISKEFKLISQGCSHKLQIRNTFISTSDKDKKNKFGKQVLEHFNKFSFMNDQEDGYNFKQKSQGQPQSKKEEEPKDQQQNKKKKNKKNKKKNKKKNEIVQNQDDSKSIAESQKIENEVKQLSITKSISAKTPSIQKSEEERNLTNYLQSWKVDDKERHECHPQENFLGKCRFKLQKWKKNAQ